MPKNEIYVGKLYYILALIFTKIAHGSITCARTDAARYANYIATELSIKESGTPSGRISLKNVASDIKDSEAATIYRTTSSKNYTFAVLIDPKVRAAKNEDEVEAALKELFKQIVVDKNQPADVIEIATKYEAIATLIARDNKVDNDAYERVNAFLNKNFSNLITDLRNAQSPNTSNRPITLALSQKGK